MTNWAKSKNITVICYAPFRLSTPELVENDVLKGIAAKHQKSVQQIALRWSMQKGNIVIPRSFSHNHQRDNMESLKFKLDDDDIDKIDKIPEKAKVITWTEVSNHPDYPYGQDDDN